MRVSIVTPTTGNPLLKQAVQSVQAQDYDNIEYIIVIDGEERRANAEQVLGELSLAKDTRILQLPYITGHSRYRGHRIYGASSFLVEGDYIIYLDEDNWLDPHHVSSLAAIIEEHNLDWAYALRKIVDQLGTLITFDDSESLGQYPIWGTSDKHHVDTNCYCLKKEIAIQLSPIWYRKGRSGLMSPDQALCYQLLQKFPNCLGSGQYTVNYRVQICPQSLHPHPGFFMNGNAWMKTRYPQHYPWRKEYQNNSPENSAPLGQKLSDLTLGQFNDNGGPDKQLPTDSRPLLDSEGIEMNRNFIIFSPESQGLLNLCEVLSHHPDIFCTGNIFHPDRNHKDVVYAHQILTSSQAVGLGNIPEFYAEVANQKNVSRVGFCLACPIDSTLSMADIAVLIESGYKIILLKAENPLKTFCWGWLTGRIKSNAQLMEAISRSNTSAEPIYIDVEEASHWIQQYHQALAWIEPQLERRAWGYYHTSCNYLEITDSISLIMTSLFEYLGVQEIDYKLDYRTGTLGKLFSRLQNKAELERVCGYDLDNILN